MRFLAFAIFAFVLLSCTQSGDSGAENETFLTLKAEAENKSHYYGWVEELEGDRLSENISDFTEKIKLSNIALESILVTCDDEPLLPILHGFGGLDTSSIPPEIKDVLINFCDALIKKDGLEKCMEFFSDDTFFVLAFFINDIAEKEISSYLIGSPFVGENNFEVPVRFFSDGNFFDCAVFFDLGDNVKINQIQFLPKKLKEE